LGGSEAAADFLKLKQEAEMALISTETTQTCTEAKEQEADTWNAIGIGTSECGKSGPFKLYKLYNLYMSKGTLRIP